MTKVQLVEKIISIDSEYQPILMAYTSFSGYEYESWTVYDLKELLKGLRDDLKFKRELAKQNSQPTSYGALVNISYGNLNRGSK